MSGSIIVLQVLVLMTLAKAKFFYEFNTLEKLKGILSYKLLKRHLK